MKTLRIGTRLAIAFALVTLLMVVTVVFARMGLVSISDDMDKVLHDRYTKVKIINDIGFDVHLHAGIVRNLVIMDSEAQREAEIQRLMASRKDIAEN